jgi:hypothetical protein
VLEQFDLSAVAPEELVEDRSSVLKLEKVNPLKYLFILI